MSYFEELAPEMDRYLDATASQEPAILRQLRRETYQKTTQPHMISGVQQGRLLAMLSKMLRPKHILEIGTFTGYATLALAEGLPQEGKITTLDVNEDLAYLPQKYFQSSDYRHQIEFLLKDAKDYLKETDNTFDMVFIDADKESYPEYLSLVKPKLNAGGVLLFDNVLWYGKVLEEEPKQKATQSIQRLNQMAAEDEDFDNIILPIRDGLNLLRKK